MSGPESPAVQEHGCFDVRFNISLDIKFDITQESVSSSGIGEVLCSPSTGCRNEACTISSPLRANRGAMHCCSSLTVSQRTPVGPLDSLSCASSTPAKARVLCYLIILKLGEAGEVMYCSSQSLGMAGGGACHPEVLCWARGSQKAAAHH